MRIAFVSIKKNIFQIGFALICIGLALYFIKQQWHELSDAKDLLLLSRHLPLFIGIIFTGVYILCQVFMYVYSFKTIGKNISFMACLRLYLKRNVASVFLPGGGITSLAFFKDEIEQEGATKAQIYFSSIIYGFTGIFSVLLISIPILGYALLKHSYGSSVYYSFAALVLLIVSILSIVYSIYKRGWIYRIIVKYNANFETTINDLRLQPFYWSHLVLANIFSLFIEVIGIVHLFLAIAAIGLEPSLEACMIGYVVSVLFLTVSPFMRGLGGIEVGMVFVLSLYGMKTVPALSATLLFRIFEFWLPLFIGLLAFTSRKGSNRQNFKVT